MMITLCNGPSFELIHDDKETCNKTAGKTIRAIHRRKRGDSARRRTHIQVCCTLTENFD